MYYICKNLANLLLLIIFIFIHIFILQYFCIMNNCELKKGLYSIFLLLECKLIFYFYYLLLLFLYFACTYMYIYRESMETLKKYKFYRKIFQIKVVGFKKVCSTVISLTLAGVVKIKSKSS